MLKIEDLQIGGIYHCFSKTSEKGFTQLIRYLGNNNIDVNVDITNVDKPILRHDRRISNNSKWEIRDAAGFEASIYFDAIKETIPPNNTYVLI